MTSDFFSNEKQTTLSHCHTGVSAFSRFKEGAGTVREMAQPVRPTLGKPHPKPIPVPIEGWKERTNFESCPLTSQHM